MEMFQAQAEKETEKNDSKEEEDLKDDETTQQERHTAYGDTEEVELVNWEEAFTQHIEETKRLNKEKEELLEKKNKKQKSWEMLRTCVEYIKENEKKWKVEEDDRLTVRQRTERLNKKNQLERQFKEKAMERETKEKITTIWKRLPAHERIHVMRQEEKRQRLELREIKINLWKKCRNCGHTNRTVFNFFVFNLIITSFIILSWFVI